MRKKEDSIAATILDALWNTAKVLPHLLPKPFETKYSWASRLRHLNPDSYRRTVDRLRNQGYLEVVLKNGRIFVKLTKAGELEALMNKVSLNRGLVWDRKWRVVIFDIPESSKEKRDLLRFLLKRNNFVRLQASVYISPYSFTRNAIRYLKETKLISFIRIMRADELDDDRDLKKKFNLK